VPPTSRRPSSSPSPTEAPEHPPTQPDIYYIVLDEYSGERALAQHYGFDNRPFLDALRARGLFVAEHATTNYARTSMSLASALNLDYLQQLTQPVPADQSDPGPIDRLVQNDEVPRLLKARGYTYYHLRSWWSDTKTNPQADVNERMSSTEDEARKLGIALPAFRGGSPGKYYFDRAEYMRVLFQFAKLAELGDVAGPKFVFGHILCPHGPFVFDPAGGWVDQMVRATMPEDEDYIRQLQFVNSKVLALVDRLLSLPPDRRPVIIIQSDEGWLSGSLAETNSPDSSLLVHFRDRRRLLVPRVLGARAVRDHHPGQRVQAGVRRLLPRGASAAPRSQLRVPQPPAAVHVHGRHGSGPSALLSLPRPARHARRPQGTPRRRSSCWLPFTPSRSAPSNRSRPTRRSRTSPLRHLSNSAMRSAPMSTRRRLPAEHRPHSRWWRRS
jgi:hypothetical protein